MKRDELKDLLAAVAAGSMSVDDALAQAEQVGQVGQVGRACATQVPAGDLGYARPDFDRGARQGVGEVVYGEGKTADQIAGICRALVEGGQGRVLVTRVDAQKAEAVAGAFVQGDPLRFTYHEQARIGIVEDVQAADAGLAAGAPGTIVVAAAGTSDIAVAEEAAITAEFLGNTVVRCYDVGVAGIHRLFACADELAAASVVVAVAGMEGALPSVVAGLVSCPVIAVPTSVGYGASFGGITALLAMLNSCASGVSVVNIDNGFGAGYQASLINRASAKKRE